MDDGEELKFFDSAEKLATSGQRPDARIFTTGSSTKNI